MIMFGPVVQRIVIALGVAGAYAVILWIWFFMGALTGWVLAFRWFSAENWVGPIEAVILTIPHAFLLGAIGCLIALPFSIRTAVIIAAIPVAYAALAIVLFIGYMFM